METITNHLEIVYALSIICATYIFLNYFIRKTTDIQRVLITLLVGLILGIIWMLFIKPTPAIDKMLLALFASMGFYKVFLKQIKDRLGLDYNNHKGLGNDDEY